MGEAEAAREQAEAFALLQLKNVEEGQMSLGEFSKKAQAEAENARKEAQDAAEQARKKTEAADEASSKSEALAQVRAKVEAAKASPLRKWWRKLWTGDENKRIRDHLR